jgi:hemolysin D
MNVLARRPDMRGAIRLPSSLRVDDISSRLKALVDQEDKEFLPAALEIRDRPASPFALAFVWIVAAGFGAALLWSCLARLDIFAVASGRVQISGRSKVVQPFEPGTVRAVHVGNGLRVRAGDVLVELDPTEALADLTAKSGQLESAEAELARRDAQVAILRGQGPQEPVFPPLVTAPSSRSTPPAVRASWRRSPKRRRSRIGWVRASPPSNASWRSCASGRACGRRSSRSRPGRGHR